MERLRNSSGRFLPTGRKQVQRNLARARKAFRRSLGAALYHEGSALLAQSLKLVPVDTGRLRSTGYVSPPEDEVGGVFVEVGYGTDYAVRQHEDSSLRHRVGQAKFLQQPFEESERGMLMRLQADMRRIASVGGGFGLRGRG